MRHDDPHAKNLLMRLRSLVVTEDSDRIENLCTEVLAWCLLSSKSLLDRFLEAIDAPLDTYKIHTQFYAKTSSTNCVYFDLVLQGETNVIIAEVKTWSNFGTNQLSVYEDASAAAFKSCRCQLITITPFAGAVPGSEKNIPWSVIKKLLETTAGKISTEGEPFGIFQQFADFLEANQLGVDMKLNELNLANLTALTKAGPMYNQVQELMRGLGRNFDVLRLIGRANIDRLVVQYHKEDRALDIGVGSVRRMPEYWAGIRCRDEGTPLCHLLISVGARGDLSALKSRLPKSFAHFKETSADEGDPSSESWHVVFVQKWNMTWFNFFKPLDLTGEIKPWEVLGWFEDILRELKSFIEGLPSQTLPEESD